MYGLYVEAGMVRFISLVKMLEGFLTIWYCLTGVLVVQFQFYVFVYFTGLRLGYVCD